MSPHARASDPYTSHLAAAAVMEYTQLQILIMGLFDASDNGYTDEELVKAYGRAYGNLKPASDSSIRSRRAELRDRGDLHDSGKTRLTRLGHKSIVWIPGGMLL